MFGISRIFNNSAENNSFNKPKSISFYKYWIKVITNKNEYELSEIYETDNSEVYKTVREIMKEDYSDEIVQEIKILNRRKA